jgi:hypothetical protein
VIFVDLKQHVGSLASYKDSNSFMDIAMCFALENDDKFERELFKHHFAKGQIVLLFDGYDEICPDYEDFMIDFFCSSKSFGCKQMCNSELFRKLFELLKSTFTSEELADCITTTKFKNDESLHFAVLLNSTRFIEKFLETVESFTFDQQEIFWKMRKPRFFEHFSCCRLTQDVHSKDSNNNGSSKSFSQ